MFGWDYDGDVIIGEKLCVKYSCEKISNYCILQFMSFHVQSDGLMGSNGIFTLWLLLSDAETISNLVLTRTCVINSLHTTNFPYGASTSFIGDLKVVDDNCDSDI